jgi:hypothetical protein
MALTDTAIRATKPGRRPFKLYDRDGLSSWSILVGQSFGGGDIGLPAKKD